MLTDDCKTSNEEQKRAVLQNLVRYERMVRERDLPKFEEALKKGKTLISKFEGCDVHILTKGATAYFELMTHLGQFCREVVELEELSNRKGRGRG